MDTGQLRQFVMVSDGRTGIVVANDECGGVFRGHCNVWFGEYDALENPVVEQLLVAEDWKEVPSPIGELSKVKDTTNPIDDVIIRCKCFYCLDVSVEVGVNELFYSGFPLCPNCDEDMGIDEYVKVIGGKN